MPGLITYGYLPRVEKLFHVAKNYNLDTDVIEMFLKKPIF